MSYFSACVVKLLDLQNTYANLVRKNYLKYARKLVFCFFESKIMRRNKDPLSINANLLNPGTKYVMKIWPKEYMSDGPKKITTITFINYLDKTTSNPCDPFKMEDLVAHDNRVCVVKNYKNELITLGVQDSHSIWVTNDGDRVTFNKLPAVTTP